MDAKPIVSAAFSASDTSPPFPMILSDQTVCLRRFHVRDVPRLFEAASESLDELCTSMTWCHPGYSLDDSTSFVLRSYNQWEKGEHFSFAICDAADREFLGSIGLSHLNTTHRFANLGYWVRTSRAGQGIATAATRMVARWAFTQLRLNRLEIVVAANNEASRRVAEKAGARREGVMRNRLNLGGERLDAVMYALVPQDFKA
jgi:RimJ/RimL family protein N-acetyltransferase